MTAATLADGDCVREQDLPQWMTAREPVGGDTLEAHERRLVYRTLAQHGGNHTRAAQALGISRTALVRRLQAWRREDATRPPDLRS